MDHITLLNQPSITELITEIARLSALLEQLTADNRRLSADNLRMTQVIALHKCAHKWHYTHTPAIGHIKECTRCAKAVVIAPPTFGAPANPSGLCQCGCGQVTPTANQGSARLGYQRGEHMRFIHGHASRSSRGSFQDPQPNDPTACHPGGDDPQPEGQGPTAGE